MQFLYFEHQFDAMNLLDTIRKSTKPFVILPTKLKTFYTYRPHTSKVSLSLFARVSSQWAKCAVYFEYFEQFEVVFNKCHHTRLV